MSGESGIRIVIVTCRDEKEGTLIAERLVEERLAACVNIIPGVRSIYRWKDKIEHASECSILVKTTEPLLAAVHSRVRELHSYELPEFVAIDPSSVGEAYGDWILENLGSGPTPRR